MKIGILGTGIFAMAIGKLLEYNSIQFTFIGRDEEQLNELNKYGTNKKYTTHKFQNGVKTEIIPNDFSDYTILFFCLPSLYINIISKINKHVFIIFTCKGFNEKFIYEKFTNYSILSGGSYAIEILKGIPCYLTLSSENTEQNITVKNILYSKNCIISLNNYPKSIELLGIFKNILSIFCGIIAALDMGKNIESAFISIILKNLKNISDFNETVLIEPAGIGDIFLSCSSEKSRNFRFGSNLVFKKNVNNNDTIEGYNSLINLSDNMNNSLINNMNMVINGLQNNKSLSEIKNLVLEIIHNYS